VCVTASTHTEQSQRRGQLVEPGDADLRRAERHADAISFVEHPIRQLAAQIRPLARVDARQRLAAPERRDLQRAAEQRMPTVGNGRESETVCRMSGPGRAGRERRTDDRRADHASASPERAAPARRTPCACPYARSPATPGPRSEPGSSPGQNIQNPPERIRIDIAIDPHATPTAEIDLDHPGPAHRAR
jgi:hypothetical protein